VATIPDPELPMVSIADLGILRDIREDESGFVVEITPTYSGCPAVDAIRDDILRAMDENGVPGRVEVVLSPAWTTDWITDAGREALSGAGIAPPRPRVGTIPTPTPDSAGALPRASRRVGPVSLWLGIRCPRCGSLHTRELSHFGSTACKALWVCERCHEPFDRFKEL
jgi:ring-1,2-phenylacetyl-CoA epoxidase subunit PaaD